MRTSTRRIGKGILFLLPFFIGTVGFYFTLQDGLLNAMYRALRLYVTELDCDYSQVTPLIELARWTAPLMSAAAILAVLDRAFGVLRNLHKAHREGTVAIHGDSSFARYFIEQLGARAIEGGSMSWRVKDHVLMFPNDREMLSYLSKNEHDLFRNDHRVYLCTEHIVRENYQNSNLVVSNFPEICARNYWRSFPIQMSEGDQSIVIIGFDGYGQQLLTQALLTNIYGIDIHFQYHIFGDGAEYCGLHTQLGQIVSINEENPERDSILFHSEPWFSARETLEKADRVILAMDDDERNLWILNELRAFFQAKDIHIRVWDRALLEGLWSTAVPFGTMDEICTEQCILNQETMLDARRIHCKYFRENVCPDRERCDCENCLDCSSAQRDWNSQTSFTVYSNAAQADHMPVKIHILLGDDYRNFKHAGERAESVFEGLSYAKQMELAELEHIRWERYHFINNWTYAPTRDSGRRQHPLLIEFSALEAKDQRKDFAPWYNAFSLYRDEPEHVNTDYSF